MRVGSWKDGTPSNTKSRFSSSTDFGRTVREKALLEWFDSSSTNPGAPNLVRPGMTQTNSSPPCPKEVRHPLDVQPLATQDLYGGISRDSSTP